MAADVEWTIHQHAREWSVNNVWFCKYGKSVVIGSLWCITAMLPAFIVQRGSNTVTTPLWEWSLMEWQWFLVSHLGKFMFQLVPNIHLSDIGSCYRHKQPRHPSCHILQISLNGASMIFSFASWVIYVPSGYRHPFIQYWNPLLAKTTAECSLPHPENKRQWDVNSLCCSIFGNKRIAWIVAFISELFTALIGKYTIYQT